MTRVVISFMEYGVAGLKSLIYVRVHSTSPVNVPDAPVSSYMIVISSPQSPLNVTTLLTPVHRKAFTSSPHSGLLLLLDY
jgi:hypothetical protein